MNNNRFVRLREGAGGAGDGGAGAGGAGTGIVTTPPNPGADKPWLSHLPEDIRGDSSFSTVKAKDANEALAIIGRMHVNSQKLLGQPKLPKPQENWTPEQWKDFNRQIGVPDSPEKYAIPEFKFADGIKLDEAKLDGWKKAFHENGILPKQADAIMKKFFEEVNTDYTGRTQQSEQQSEQQKAANISALKGEFGDQYEAKIDIARTALRNFGDEALLDTVEKTGLANDPAFAKFLIKIGEQTLEDRAGGSGPGSMGRGPGAALQEINALKIDKEFQSALNSRTDPGHKAALEKWMTLHQQAYPNPK